MVSNKTVDYGTFQKMVKNLPPNSSITPQTLALGILNKGFSLGPGLESYMPDKPPVQNTTQQVQKNENPAWMKWAINAVGDTAKSLFDATQAPGNVISGLVEKPVGALFGKETQNARDLSKNAVTVLNSMPLYAGAVGAAFGMPGVGSAVGQGITEIGHDLMGDNQNTLLQQGADIGLAGLQGKILGSSSLGGVTNVPGMMLKGAGGQIINEAGKYIMGNNPNTLEQAAKNVVGAGLLTGGLTAGFDIASPTIQGASRGYKQGGISEAVPQGVKGVGEGLQTVGNQFNPVRFVNRFHSTPNIDSYIQQQWDKAVRPGVGEKKTQTQLKSYNDNVNLAIKEIAANKDSLNLTTMEGEPLATEKIDGQTVSKSSLPNSLWTASQANSQMMDKLFSSWDNLKKITGGKGVTISSEPIAAALDGIASDKVMMAQYPKTAAFAEDMAARLREQLPEITMEQAQTMAQQWNNELRAYQKNAQPNDIANGTAIAMANNILKKSLGDAIEAEVDSPIYVELKKSYAAQKAIESDLNRRVAVYYRQSPKALIDYTDILSVGDALHALASLDPGFMASAAGKYAIKTWIKGLNNPDNMIKNMFKAVDQHVTGVNTPILQRASDVIMQNSMQKSINSSLSQDSAFSPSSGVQNMPQAGNATASMPTEGQSVNTSPTTIPAGSNAVNPDGMSLNALSPNDSGIQAANDATNLMNQGKTLDQADAMVESKLPSLSPASEKTVQAFEQSTGQKTIGKVGETNFELGSFGKNAGVRKANLTDRFPESELKNTIKNIKEVFKASNDPSNYRSGNLAWVADMPNGETRIIYTRPNANGAQEIINWHSLNPEARDTYLSTLQSFGPPSK